MALKCRNANGDLVMAQLIISIEKMNELAASRLNATIAGDAGSSIGLRDEPRPAAIVSADEFGAAIAAAIINDNDFDRLITLRQAAFYRVGNIMPAIVCRDDDADERAA